MPSLGLNRSQNHDSLQEPVPSSSATTEYSSDSEAEQFLEVASESSSGENRRDTNQHSEERDGNPRVIARATQADQ